MGFTKRRNLNRGYLNVEVWQRGMDLLSMAWRLADGVSDFKLKSQFTGATQSVSANIAEGYGRRRLAEYSQFLYTAKGSLAEAFTRACGFLKAQLITDGDFEAFDVLHYEVENKLLRLISALEEKRTAGDWQDALPHPPPGPPSNPTTNSSIS